MKYKPNIYAKAFIKALMETRKDKWPELNKKLIQAVKRNNDTIHLNKIVKEIEILWREKLGLNKITVETAREKEEIIEEFKKMLKENEEIEFRVNPELIGGIRIIINDEKILDNSLKSKLDLLFKN